MSNIVYLGLGSNIGHRLNNLQQACRQIAKFAEIVSVSHVYETPPWGFEDQAAFYNQVLKIKTSLNAKSLLRNTKNIEQDLGRLPNFRNGPRLIDIDILFFNQAVIETDNLCIPHPRVHERAFMLVPLVEITPQLLHPVHGKTVQQLLNQLSNEGIKMLRNSFGNLKINGHEFVWGSKTYVMGILNITPDSFSGDGLKNQSEPITAALHQAEKFIEAGADILDIGGESTRPGSDPVDSSEELKRVVPIIRELSKNFDIPLSIDTYKSSVARAAVDSGAHIINDVWGFRADAELAQTAAALEVPVILMHNRSNPKTADIQAALGGRYIGVEYENLIEDIKKELLESIAIACAAGVKEEHIILDSGIGFGKTVEQNLELLNKTNQIRSLGYPLLIGPSRKSFIGFTLDLPPEKRAEGTAAAVAVAIVRGADIVRVHDVEMIVKVSRMTDAIVR